MQFKILILLFIFIFITSCSETSFVLNTAKRLSDISKNPRYKIGDPYEINGQWYYPEVNYDYDEIGLASWYGPNFHGKKTANGEVFDQNSISAAHKTLPMPSIVKVTNLKNNKELVIRINDRGPFVRGRIIDLSKKAAEILDIVRTGTAKVRVKILESESRKIAQINSKFEINKGVKSAKTEKILKKSLEYDDFGKSQEVVIDKNLIIQVAAFNNEENANRLVDKLSDFSAFIKHEFVKNNFFYRVRIGPFNDMSKAKKILQQLLLRGFNTSKILPNYEIN